MPEKATFALGAGCAAEWVFTKEVNQRNPGGVTSTRVGVATGTGPDITAEAVEIEFDPSIISYLTLLHYFWNAHDRWSAPDPRETGRTNAIFAHSPAQREEAEQYWEQYPSAMLPPGSREPRPVVSLICDLAAFEAAPDREQTVIVRMMDALETGYSPRANDNDGDLLVPLDLLPGEESACDDLRALAAEIGGCLDEASPGLDSRGPSFVDLMIALLRREPLQVRQLAGALRDWLAVRPSAGLADGQFDVRIVEIGVAPHAAESYVRFNRTDSALRVVNNIAAGHARANGQSSGLYRRALTGLANDGRPTDTIEWGTTGSLGAHFGTSREPTPAPTLAPGGEGHWYEHIPPVEMPVSCLNAVHTVRWSQGRLEAPEIVGIEAVRERTLSALGAPVCQCWTVVGLWDPRWILQRFLPMSVDVMWRPRDWWLSASVENRRLPGWAYEVPDHGLLHAKLRQRFPGQQVAPHPTPDELPSIEGALDDPFGPPAADRAKYVTQRLIYEAIRRQLPPFEIRWLLTSLAWMGEHHDQLGPDDRTNYASLVFRHIEQPLLEALWQPCRYDPEVRIAAIQFHLLAPGERATVEGTVEGDLVKIDVGVSFHWITQVWTRCLAIIDDHLVLDAGRQTDPHTVDVLVARWDRDTEHAAGATLVTHEATAHWTGSRWRLGM